MGLHFQVRSYIACHKHFWLYNFFHFCIIVNAQSKIVELMIITKGDLFDQESKIARSGLAHFFSKVEIVSEKNEPTNYRSILS